MPGRKAILSRGFLWVIGMVTSLRDIIGGIYEGRFLELGLVKSKLYQVDIWFCDELVVRESRVAEKSI
jgi:hypothetical protein